MDIIRPVTISDAQFVSSTIAENDYAVWSSAATYALGARVIVTTAGDHHCYESLQASNINHNPKASPDWWLDLGADNRWAAFDNVVGTKSSKANAISFTLLPGSINSLALLDMIATSVDVVMVANSVTIYNHSFDLSFSYIYDWYTYFFEPAGYNKHCW